MSLAVPSHGYTVPLATNASNACYPQCDANGNVTRSCGSQPDPLYYGGKCNMTGAPQKPPASPMQSIGDTVAQLSDADLQSALDALQPNKLDAMIKRLEPKPSLPKGGADMVRAGEQNAWKWDGNQVRYLTDDEQAAEAQRERARMIRQRAQMEKTRNQKSLLRTMRPQG